VPAPRLLHPRIMAVEPHDFKRPVENLIATMRGLPTDTSRSRRRESQELGPLIERLLERYKIGRSSPEHTVREHWPELVGEANAAYSHPAHLLPGQRLVVLVSHGVVRNELFLHREALLAKVRALPGCSGIRALTFRTGA
jgi:hypothetical protein